MKNLFFVALLLLVAGCASQSEKLARHGRVIPQPEGFYQASGSHRNQDTALSIALASAEQTCVKRELRHVVYDSANSAEETLVDEKIAKTADLISIGAFAAGRMIPGGDILRGNKTETVLFRCE